ncbi:MAG: glycogen synthase GlgA [Rhodobacteraceae bacterium]|nr:glycogen synthase GlgA [Paracoccaceae bacterium]
MNRVLSVTSECAPLIKTGGLADVAGALPAALKPLGWEMITLLPGYPQVMSALGKTTDVMVEHDLFGGTARVLKAKAKGLQLFVLDAPHLYDRDGGPYLDTDGKDYGDNPQRFAALGWIAAKIATDGAGDWMPDVLHAHDWQAGLAPVYLRAFGGAAWVGSVITVHNIAFHGLAPAHLRKELRLPADGLTPEGFEFWGQISTLKAGLNWSDRITTVSPTYARELMTPEFGMGLDGVIRSRAGVLSGILNGIDTEVWDPDTDPDVTNFATPAKKRAATAALREEMGLEDNGGPLAVVVSRLTEQKGLDLLIEALPGFLSRDGQLALLGSGDGGLEEAFQQLADTHSGVAVRIGYDEALSHRMMAGADAVLVPSRFEPCGLTQMYALRYGAIPVVARTGGLADTVIDANAAALRSGAATGIQFYPVTAEALSGALHQLVDLFEDTKIWKKMQKTAMRQDVSWAGSAAEYAALYESIGTAE